MNQLSPFLRFTLILFGFVLIAVVMVIAKDLLLPLSWAMLLALLMLPLQYRLERGLRNRAIAAILNVAIITVVVGGVLFLLFMQMMNLLNDLPGIISSLINELGEIRIWIEENLGIPYDDQPAQLRDRLLEFFPGESNSLSNFLGGTIKTIVFAGLMPVYIFFLLYYRHRLKMFFSMLYVQAKRDRVMLTLWKAAAVVQKYLSGMLMVTTIIAVMVFVLFLLIGVKNALFFAVFVAVFNLIPYLGVVLGSLVSILYVYITKDSLLYPFITLAALWGIQILENNLITPYVVGRQVRLNPLAILLVIFLGGLIWGVSGMILFIPLLGGIKVILDEIPGLRPYGFLLGDDSPDS